MRLSLTRLGAVVLAGGLAVAVTGWQLAWHEFVVFGVVALLLVALGAFWVAVPGQPRVQLEVRPHRVHHGGRVVATVEVQAASLPLVGARFAVPVGGLTTTVGIGWLAPYRRAKHAVDLPHLRRGVYDVGPARWIRTDPVQLVRRQVDLSDRELLLVRPRVVHVPVFAPGLTDDLEGTASSQLSMSDLAFHALREYVPGDDLRHVHWRSSAKASTLLVRQYHTSRRGHVTVVLDHEPGSYRTADDFELAVSISTSLALRAVQDDLDTCFRCGDAMVVGRQAEAVLDLACGFSLQPGDFRAVVGLTAAAAPGTGLLVLVSGAHRTLADIRAAASAFPGETRRLVVRADAAAEVRSVDGPGGQDLTVSALEQLGGLLARGMR